MDRPREVIIFSGSPRRGKTTSGAIARYLQKKFSQAHVACRVVNAIACLEKDPSGDGLIEAVATADLFIFAFPLYFDSLPCQLIRCLEIICERRDQIENIRARQFAAIVQSGYPEAQQNDVALSVCRCFVREAGLIWAGGMAMGGGSMVNGEPLESMGRRLRHVTAALDLAAAAWSEGRSLPSDAVSLMAKPPLPWKFLYRVIANGFMKSESRRRGVSATFRSRPYLDSARNGSDRQPG